MPPPEYFQPDEPIAKHGNVLPHWAQGEVFIFATWRLADAIPQQKLRALAAHREAWLAVHPRPWDEAVERDYHQRFSDQVDAWLDTGSGSCVLKRRDLNGIVAAALHHFDGHRYFLDSLVVMPKHVHVIFRPSSSHAVAAIVQSWKRHTAGAINRVLEKVGPLWQERYWDRLLRSPLHHLMCREYLRRNPGKAGLGEGEYLFWERPVEVEEKSGDGN